MMNWWVDRGVDGFRMDVINLISKSGSGRRRAARRAQAGACFEFTANGPRLDEFLAEMNAAVGLDARNLLTVGEMPGSTIETARPVTDPASHELNMVFTFEHVSLDAKPGGRKWDLHPLSLPVLKQNLNDWQVGLAEVGWNSLYWDNHDQPRAVSRFGDDSPEHRVNSAKTLATVQHMHKGTPYVYQGEELGMTNTYFADIGQYHDIESINYHADALSLGLEAEAVLHSLSVKSRDNARTPMQWDDTTHAGFTDGIPWLPVNPNYVTINAAAAVAEPDSVFHHFRKLIELRHELPVVAHGRFELLLPDHEQIWALTRTLDDQVLVMLANCSSEPVTVPDGSLPDLSSAQVLLATHPGRERRWTWRPWESRIYLLRLSRRSPRSAGRSPGRPGRPRSEPGAGTAGPAPTRSPRSGRTSGSRRRRRRGPARAGRRCRRRCRSASRRTGWWPAAGTGSCRSGTPGGPARPPRRPGPRARSASPRPRSWRPGRSAPAARHRPP